MNIEVFREGVYRGYFWQVFLGSFPGYRWRIRTQEYPTVRWQDSPGGFYEDVDDPEAECPIDQAEWGAREYIKKLTE